VHLHGVHRRFDVHDRAGVEILAEDFGVDRGRRDDHLELGAFGQDPFEQPEDEIDVQAPLVRLIHHDQAVTGKGVVCLDLLQQNPVGHDLDAGSGIGQVIEAHLESDRVGNARATLTGNELGNGDGGYSSRLGDADDTVAGETRVQKDLGNLSGLTAAGGTFNDDDPVGDQGVEYPGLLLIYGKV